MLEIVCIIAVLGLAVSNIIKEFTTRSERKELYDRLMSADFIEYKKLAGDEVGSSESAYTRSHKRAVRDFHKKGVVMRE